MYIMEMLRNAWNSIIGATPSPGGDVDIETSVNVSIGGGTQTHKFNVPGIATGVEATTQLLPSTIVVSGKGSASTALSPTPARAPGGPTP